MRMKTIHTCISCLVMTILLISATCNKDKCVNNMLGEADYRLKIRNNSSRTITYEMQFNFPDTSLWYVQIHDLAANPTRVIKPGTVQTVQHLGHCWESAFADEIPSGKLQLFLFDEQVIKNNPWETVRSNYMILKRLTYTLDELKSMDWQITYQ